MTNNITAPSNRRRRLVLGALAFVVLAAIVATVCVVALRPKTIPVIETEAEESLPSLLQVAPIGEQGAILVEHTTLLEDPSVSRYYVNIQDLDPGSLEGVTDPDTVALYLSTTSEVRAEDLPKTQTSKLRRKHRKLEKMVADDASALFIGLLNSVEFPYRLDDNFVIGDFTGALLVQGGGYGAARASKIVYSAPFVDVGSLSEMIKPENMDKPAVEMAEEMMKNKSDMVMDKSPPLVLNSDLEGNYNLDQVSITIDTVSQFQNGAVVDVARLVFEIPQLADAPGPYLYLSKRPYSQTRDANLDNAEDMLIPIEGGTDGQFNVQGRFEQFLDLDVADLEEYVGGSWIVWCRPFGVWLGGGEITA